MASYKYLIIGGGMTGAAAVAGIRSQDADGSIGLISREPHPPYNRPPLSKGLWKGKNEADIWRDVESSNIDLVLGRAVTAIDPNEHLVTDDHGDEYPFERLLLATGGRPRRLPFGEDHILYFRTLGHYHQLRQLSQDGASFAIIGGGFIGSELAAALADAGNQVTMVFPEPTIGAGRFPPGLGEFLNGDYLGRGVRVLNGHAVTDVSDSENGLTVSTDQDEPFESDAVVAGLGIIPNTALAEAAGLEVDDGIVVDAGLKTSAADIFAAGDVASFHNPTIGARMRVEHEDNANTMGQFAGMAMAGAEVSYDYLPYFYSDMFDNGYEALGRVDNRLETVEDWQTTNQQGVIYYLENGRVVGVVLWNTWGKLDEARSVLEMAGPVDPAALKGKIA